MNAVFWIVAVGVSPAFTARQTIVPLTDVSGVQTATFDDSLLGGGQHTIAATYSGDSNFATSTATPLTQVINTVTPNITLTSSANPSTWGSSS